MTRQIKAIILSLLFYGFVAPAGADTVRIGSGILDSTAPVGGTTGVQVNRVSRTDTASAWAAPKAFPGPIFNSGIHFQFLQCLIRAKCDPDGFLRNQCFFHLGAVSADFLSSVFEFI